MILTRRCIREILWREGEEDEEDKYCWVISNLGNSLSMLCRFKSHAELWVLKKCGLDEYWTKLFAIPYMDTLNYDQHLKTICITKNGDIMLLHNFKTILLYKSKDNTLDKLFEMDYVSDERRYFDADVCTYVESLVSP